MSPKMYALYMEQQMKLGLPVFPNDQGISPKDFGMRYLGSKRHKKNTIQRKRMAKWA